MLKGLKDEKRPADVTGACMVERIAASEMQAPKAKAAK
jgi:hypothetical protein